ncbi:MAG: hypothetical protein PHY08_08330 [Candidatus Cloacimonetes bacterium]|nr:hypothetical protein [Candidatus Cloacimonadota bacterium]
MKKTIFSFTLFIIVVNSFSQVEVEYYDTIYTDFSFTKCNRVLKDSLNDGEYILYFSSNKNRNKKQIKDIVSYKGGVRNGLFVSYQMIEDIHFISSVGLFKNGNLDGHFIEFNTERNIIKDGDYKDGIRIGTWYLIYDSQKYLLYYNNNGHINNWECVDKQGNITSKGDGAPEFLRVFVNNL